MMLRKLYRWFLARFRLNLRIVCEESANRGPHDDFHDYEDHDPPEPWHFTELTCRRCGKKFFI